MRVLFTGTPEVALPALHALLDSEHEVVGVLTRPPARAGRRRNLTPSAVHRAAAENDVPLITSNNPHLQEDLDQIRALAPDVAAVVAYGALLREPALSALPRGWINLHFSLLPAWRGAAPVQHAIRAGDTTTGVSTFQIEAGLDTGPVYATRSHPIGPRDTAGDLLSTLATIGADVLIGTLDDLAAGIATPTPQPAHGVSHAPRLGSAEARIDWHAPAPTVDRLIRSVTPAPGAWTQYQGRRMKITPVIPAPADAPQSGRGRPGEVLLSQGEVWVGTGSDPVRLTQVAPAGKGWMKAADWARGARLPDGATFDAAGAHG